jgi:hypothetical protein
MSMNISPDDIIDVTVTISSAPHPTSGLQASDLPLAPLRATRQERYAWRREVFDLLQPELEPWTHDVLFAQQERPAATQVTLDRVHHALRKRLREAGVSDVFAPVVGFMVDDRGIPCIVNVALSLTPAEIELFGEQPA